MIHACREPSKFRGTQGTAVVGVFDLTAASTGASERTLKRLGMPYKKVGGWVDLICVWVA